MFEKPPEKYSAAVIMKILLSSNIGEKMIAYKRPIQVQSSITFVIDLTKLAHPDDIKRDAYGRWIQNGYTLTYLSASMVKMEKFLSIKQLLVPQVPTCTIYGGFIVCTHQILHSEECWHSYVVR